jgi:hypothetical protein
MAQTLLSDWTPEDPAVAFCLIDTEANRIIYGGLCASATCPAAGARSPQR